MASAAPLVGAYILRKSNWIKPDEGRGVGKTKLLLLILLNKIGGD